MKQLSFSLLFGFMTVAVNYAQDLPEWQNPDVMEVNREDPHATRFSFDSFDQAIEGEKNASANYMTLNVDWKQMGVGGDNSWGARTHVEYLLRAEPMKYSYVISPL